MRNRDSECSEVSAQESRLKTEVNSFARSPKLLLILRSLSLSLGVNSIENPHNLCNTIKKNNKNII